MTQRGDGLGDAVLEVADVERTRGVGRAGVLDGVHQRHLVAAGVGHAPELVERDDRGVRDGEQRIVEFVDGDAELVRELLVGGRALEGVLELGVGALDFAGAGAHAARHPVERAQLVDDGALDARDGRPTNP
jgi:hypothetical protein